MTGYGAGHAHTKVAQVDVEVRTVNNRHLDVRFNFPRECVVLEAEARERVQARITRGTATVMLFVRPAADATPLAIDEKHAHAVITRLKRMAIKAGLKPEGSLDTLLRVPGLVRAADDALDAARIRVPFAAALDTALDQLVATRSREGTALAKDMRSRVARVRTATREIEKLAPQVTERFTARLTKRFEELKAQTGVEFEPVRILTETGVFAERADIAEELTRIRSHLDHFSSTLATGGGVGKRLDFILQELFREITTIGNKANSADISRHAVGVKEELEKLREQAQNIE